MVRSSKKLIRPSQSFFGTLGVPTFFKKTFGTEFGTVRYLKKTVYNIMQLIKKNNINDLHCPKNEEVSKFASRGTKPYFNVFSFTGLIKLHKCF